MRLRRSHDEGIKIYDLSKEHDTSTKSKARGCAALCEASEQNALCRGGECY